jgi:hypothetical protein
LTEGSVGQRIRRAKIMEERILDFCIPISTPKFADEDVNHQRQRLAQYYPSQKPNARKGKPVEYDHNEMSFKAVEEKVAFVLHFFPHLCPTLL